MITVLTYKKYVFALEVEVILTFIHCKMIKVNLTADDFGYCKRRNQGIVQLCAESLIDRVSLIVNAIDTVDAAESAKEWVLQHACEKKQFPSVGLHLNLTEGKPISNIISVHSLVNNDGLFFGKLQFREELEKNRLKQSEIKLEICSQIEKFKGLMGSLPAYVDGHQHIHVLPVMRDVFAETLNFYGITETRLPIELGIEDCDSITETQYSFFESVCKHSTSAVPVFQAQGLSFSDYFVGLSTMGRNMTSKNVQKAFDKILETIKHSSNDIHGKRSYIVEFMVHPGFRSIPNNGGCFSGPDEFSLSHEREIELEFLQKDYKQILIKYQNIVK